MSFANAILNLPASSDETFMKEALKLARRGMGRTSPNPMVGAVLVREGGIVGRGWHRRAGMPHAEVEAIGDALRTGQRPRGATLYVTLEPCSTQGRTPPCTEAIRAAGIRRVVAGAEDPNPRHAGRGLEWLRSAGTRVVSGVLAGPCTELNAAFNRWIVHRTPLVTVKAAMTLDGRIATASGESRWITGERSRAHAMRLRRNSDAILVGINTVLADDPSLTVRTSSGKPAPGARLLRVVLDSRARTPLSARMVTDDRPERTLIVVSERAPGKRVRALEKRVSVLRAPESGGRIDLRRVLKELGKREIVSLLVEGGGEVNAAFLEGRLAQRIAFFYAPMILGGAGAKRAVAGKGATGWRDIIRLQAPRWKRLGDDLLLEADIGHDVA